MESTCDNDLQYASLEYTVIGSFDLLVIEVIGSENEKVQAVAKMLSHRFYFYDIIYHSD